MGCSASRIDSRSCGPSLDGRICITGLEQCVQTGDVLLFSSTHAASNVTKCFTASTWDHCGLVVKLSPKHIFILEYAGGVYLYPLFTRLYSYFALQGREIRLRKLKTNGSRAEMQAQVETFVKGVLGQAPPSLEEMVVAVLKQGPALNAFISKLRGNQDEVEDNLSSLFCSKLVAALYKHVGLIGSGRASGDFLPKHFSQEYDDYVDLQGGASLGPEIQISFDAVQAEVDEIRKAVEEEERYRPEALIKLISSLYLSCSSAVQSWVSLKSLKCMPRELNTKAGDTFASPAPRPKLKSLYSKPTDDDGPPTASPSSASSSAGDESTSPASQLKTFGGVEITSGKIVEDVLNTNDGGIYSPKARAYKSRTAASPRAAGGGGVTGASKLDFGRWATDAFWPQLVAM